MVLLRRGGGRAGERGRGGRLLGGKGTPPGGGGEGGGGKRGREGLLEGEQGPRPGDREEGVRALRNRNERGVEDGGNRPDQHTEHRRKGKGLRRPPEGRGPAHTAHKRQPRPA